MTGISFVQSTTVDSTPTLAGPPSSMPAIFPFKSSSTCSAAVGLGFPEIFALGAAIGRPELEIKSNATSLSGIRTPTVVNPAVTLDASFPLLFNTYVIGPGEKQ